MKQPSRKTAMWFAAQTRYRCEKAVFRTLGKKGISSYLPLVRTSRTYGTRRRIIECPLIPNYIFVHITRSDYLKVLQTNHLVDFIRFGSELVPIPQLEIDILEKWCTNIGSDMTISNQVHRTGERVQIIIWTAKGVMAKLLTVKGEEQLVVELENIGHSLQIVQMDTRYVRHRSGVGA